MRIRARTSIGAGLMSLLSSTPLSAQVKEAKAPAIKAPDASWRVPRTAWGHPDLQGVWTSDDLQGVPVERPKEYGTRRFLTEQEMAERDGRVTRLIESAATGERPKEGFRASQRGVDAAAVPANWVEFARRASALTSLVTDPPDGRIPPLTEEAQYSEDLTLVKHFRRTGPQTLEYSVTVNDPRTYTARWRATFPLTAEPGYQIFEYACHEGNYAMRNRLSAARAEEAREATGRKIGDL
jgi:hypothetical protein